MGSNRFSVEVTSASTFPQTISIKKKQINKKTKQNKKNIQLPHNKNSLKSRQFLVEIRSCLIF